MADVLIAFILLALFSPFLFAGLLRNSRLDREVRVGRWCEPFLLLTFEPRSTFLRHIAWVPSLINVLRGDMSLIGPRAVRPGELSPRERVARRRYDVRPGLVSLWYVRRGGNVGYGTEAETDAEYVDTLSLRGDLGISLRSLPATFYGAESAVAADELHLLGIRIDNLTMSEAIDRIIDYASQTRPAQVCFVNADCANIAWNQSSYRAALNSASLCVADGIGMKLAGKILTQPVKQNVNGTDLFPRLCARLDASLPVFLLGARPGVADVVAEWIRVTYPSVVVAGTQHGYFSADEELAVVQAIRSSGARVLMVAFGSPKQDLWIHQHLKELGVGAAMGVGGLFDFYSGRIPRAPQWMREIGLEWAYRLIQEPGRMWKRYLWGNLLFLTRVAKEQVRNR